MISTNKFLHYFDWITFLLAVIINIIGLAFIFSATYSPQVPVSIFFKKQCIGLICALLLHFLITCIEYHWIMRWCYLTYPMLLTMLIFTLMRGSIGLGGQRWIDLGLFKLQPSELTKLWFPGFFAYWFTTNEERTWWKFILPLCVLLISFILIRKQPDLGTGLIILFSGIILIHMAGIKLRHFIYASIIGVLCIPIAWHILKPYQRNRIAVFFGYGDKHKERYQIEQATIAIGAGNITGSGYLQGTQNKLRFLPEGRTDFLFAVICEEWGFLGAVSILLLFLLFVGRLLSLICTISDSHIQLLSIGLVLPIALSAFINLFMVNNLLPVVGVPLPLMSYGVTNLWTTWIALGWLQGIFMQRSYVGEYPLTYPIMQNTR